MYWGIWGCVLCAQSISCGNIKVQCIPGEGFGIAHLLIHPTAAVEVL